MSDFWWNSLSFAIGGIIGLWLAPMIMDTFIRRAMAK